MDLEWSSPTDGIPIFIFNLIEFDRDAIVGSGSLLLQLLRWSLDPVILVVAATLALVEGLDDRIGSEIGIFLLARRRGWDD